ncbi:MAG: 50S ribosomal protein L11 methyltransferase [Bacteroidia bacterium]|nr:50S ribosomal protein L11 methyltransferase [Bacteroidia bacterium]
MNYLELAVTVLPPVDDNVEIVAAFLSDYGFEGSAEDENLKAYIQADKITEAEIHIIANELVVKNFIDSTFLIDTIAPRNWNDEWEKNYFQPILIGKRCLIKSSFHKTDLKADYEILIDPKMSFGTGHHETTSLMVEYLLEIDLKDKTVLDMGTGTGILGILASMLGSKSVVGIDNDSWCYENTLENLELNKIENFDICLGDAGLLKNYPHTFEVVIANINRHILLADIHYYVQAMQKGGQILLSGFYDEDLEVIQAEAEKCGLKFISHKQKNKWNAAQFIL